MMPERQLIITNLKYINARRTGRGHGLNGLRNKLKYFQFRDDRHTQIPAGQRERWIGRGLGVTYAAIQQACDAMQSADVLAWTWVVSPEPDLMQRVPKAQQIAFLKTLTEAIVERYYDARDAGAQYSYVVHDARTTDGRPHLHTHVVLPGTAWSDVEGWLPMQNYQRKGHLTLLDEIAHEELSQALDRTIGRQWRQAVGLEPDVPDDIGDLRAWFER